MAAADGTANAGALSSDGQPAIAITQALPWLRIPDFTPGETDVEQYTRTIRFLYGL